VQRTVELIGAGAGRRIDHSAGGPSILGGRIFYNDGKLLDGINRTDLFIDFRWRRSPPVGTARPRARLREYGF
jgi:hypothetical protein